MIQRFVSVGGGGGGGRGRGGRGKWYSADSQTTLDRFIKLSSLGSERRSGRGKEDDG